ncbi:MAG TPA: energy transducer TonB [Longimicrobium sp.]
MCTLPSGAAPVNPSRRGRGAPILCAAAALLAGVAACGSVRGRPSDAGLSTTWACVQDSAPAALPHVAALVDVEALAAGLAGLQEQASGGEVVLTLEYEADGTNIRREVVRHTVPPVLADSVQKLFFAARRQAPRAAAPWGVRLRVPLGQPAAYAVERREYCPPRPRSRELQFAMETPVTPGTRYRGGIRERTVLVRVRVHPAGYVHSASLLRGADRGAEFERDLYNTVRRYSFYPAMLDGQPVYGEVTVPVRIRA